VVGERGGPLHELINLITMILNETGEVLLSQGYPYLGSFVLEALREGQKTAARPGGGVDIDAVLEKVKFTYNLSLRPKYHPQIVLAIPAFRDMALVNGKRESFELRYISIHTHLSQPYTSLKKPYFC